MKSLWKGLFAAPIFATILGLTASPATAVALDEPLAEISVDKALVVFQPNVAYRDVRVSVVGPGGFESVATFKAGETPLIDLPGADGLYKYELRFSPVLDRGARHSMVSARELGIDAEFDKAAEGRVQGGFFSLADGGLVPDYLQEESEKMLLSTSDGVIRNSLCVGFDCPNSPVFGDSTILLMENNTRIKFGDTSNSPFPNNDWEIEANSSSSGGPNYLGFNDCGTGDNDGGCVTDLVFAVESGARQSALYVETDGDVGIGTSNPTGDLHIVTGNTPTLRLDQDGSAGFTSQVWDVAGNEVNFFVRDVTMGSQLPLRIRPGATTSSIDISSTGNVGIGDASPGTKLDVKAGAAVVALNLGGNAGIAFRLDAGDEGTNFWQMTSTAGDSILRFNRTGGGNEMELDSSGDLTITGEYFSTTCVTPCAPDYVFAEEYRLMPLAELESFITAEGHLPNIPSAEELTGPISLSRMQMRLLEKIEELTLYTLQQQKTIDRMGRELADLKAQ